MGKDNNIVILDYGFPGYDTWAFKDRLIRANEYLISINKPPIEGLKYEILGEKFWRRDRRALFRSLDPESIEIQVALNAYATSATQTLSEFRSRIIPIFAFVLSILSLILNLEFWRNMRFDSIIPVLLVLTIFILGYILYVSEKQITIPDSKGKGTMAIVTAIQEFRTESKASLEVSTHQSKPKRALAMGGASRLSRLIRALV